MLLNWAKRNTALFLAGSTTTPPTFFMIGSGSGTAIATQTELISAWDKQATTSVDDDTSYKVKWTGDWNSVTMSGNGLQEWGMLVSGGGLTGSMWSRTSMPTQVNFDGTAELRIEETWEVY